MKTREEFIRDVFVKSEKVKAAEEAARKKKKRMRTVLGAVSVAACLTLAVGFSGVLDSSFWTGGNDAAAGEPGTLEIENGRPVWDDGNTVGLTDGAVSDGAESSVPNDPQEGAQNAETGETDGTGEKKMNRSAVPYSQEEATELWSREELWDTNEQVRDLSIKLFQKAASTKENSMISPTSILMAMSMAENGAAGETKKQMETAFGMSTGALNWWIQAWSAVQPQNDADSKSRMNVANSVWYNNSGAFELNPTYPKTLKEILQAEVRGGDFSSSTVKAINSWCSRNTYGMIDKIVDELSPAQQTVLINAVAFEDQWNEQYQKSQIKKENFTDENGKKKKTSLMYSEEETYCQDDLATGFLKTYRSGYQFVAILPNEGVSVAEYLKQMDGESFAAFVDSGQHAVVHAVLPAFKSEYKTSALPKIFRQMGMEDLFDASAADLSGMGTCSGQNLYVDEILHKTYIDVNREGTRAAAVTGVMVRATALNPEPVREYTVRLDRPFLYAIIDAYTGTPVFLGTMMSAD